MSLDHQDLQGSGEVFQRTRHLWSIVQRLNRRWWRTGVGLSSLIPPLLHIKNEAAPEELLRRPVEPHEPRSDTDVPPMKSVRTEQL